MVFSSICICFGQLFWKLAFTEGFLYLVLGCIIYLVGGAAGFFAYRHGKLSVLQPMLSVSYVLSLFLAFWILGESISPVNIFGVVLIFGGAILVAGGDHE
jgi:undecaprenyl phosphate-alpha-L-ara4N flippase subunit ArnE